MTDAPTLTAQPPAEVDLTRRGRWCFVAGLIGVVQGAALLAWPHQVGDARFSFPLSSSWYVAAQATFFLQHLPLAAAVSALATMPVVRRDTPACRALLTASAGLALLAVMELVAMSAATTDDNSTLGTTISSLYSVPVLTAGIGLLVGGVVLFRDREIGRRLPSWLLALGGFVFVGLVPALATSSFIAGRVAIMAWMALFAAFGLVMQRRT